MHITAQAAFLDHSQRQSEGWEVSSVMKGRGQDPLSALGMWPGYQGYQLSPQVTRSPVRPKLGTAV